MFLSALVLLGILSNKARPSGILGAYEYINEPRQQPSYSRPTLSAARHHQSNDKELWLGNGGLTEYREYRGNPPELRTTNISPTHSSRDAIIEISFVYRQADKRFWDSPSQGKGRDVKARFDKLPTARPSGKLSEKASLTLEQFVAELKKRIQEKTEKQKNDKLLAKAPNERPKTIPKPIQRQQKILQRPKNIVKAEDNAGSGAGSKPSNSANIPLPPAKTAGTKKKETESENEVRIPVPDKGKDAKIVRVVTSKPRTGPGKIKPSQLPQINNKVPRLPNIKQFPSIPARSPAKKPKFTLPTLKSKETKKKKKVADDDFEDDFFKSGGSIRHSDHHVHQHDHLHAHKAFHKHKATHDHSHAHDNDHVHNHKHTHNHVHNHIHKHNEQHEHDAEHTHTEKHHHKHLEYIDAGGWKKRSDVVSNQPLIHARELVLPEEPVDRNDVFEEPIDRSDEFVDDSMRKDNYNFDDDIMELIRTELERFIGEQNIERSFGGFENIHEHEDFPVPAPVTEHSTDFKVDDIEEVHGEIRNYEAPIIDDYKQLLQLGKYDDYKHQPKHDDLFMERPFIADKALSSPDRNYLSQLPKDADFRLESQPKPNKLLELIPSAQRNKYPVEVEEISYEEYLELSKRGDTFEEPLYEDDFDEEDLMEHFNEPMVGFDSNKDVVKVKYEDPLFDLSRPRMSRRNDLDQFPYFDKDRSLYAQYLHSPVSSAQLLKTGGYPQARALVSPVMEDTLRDIQGVIETPGAMFRVMSADNITDISNRRMDTGLEDYEYIDTDGDNDLEAMENTDNNPIKGSINEEEIDTDESGDGDIDQANKVTNNFIDTDPDTEEEGLSTKMDDIPATTARSPDSLSPRPVYVVYPDTDTTAPTTENTSTATTSTSQGNLKMFDIEYDQFS